MARPQKKIDPELLVKLLSIGVSIDDAAKSLGISPDTIQRRYAECVLRGRANRNISLMKKAFDRAMNHNSDRVLLRLLEHFCGVTGSVKVIDEAQQNALNYQMQKDQAKLEGMSDRELLEKVLKEVKS